MDVPTWECCALPLGCGCGYLVPLRRELILPRTPWTRPSVDNSVTARKVALLLLTSYRESYREELQGELRWRR